MQVLRFCLNLDLADLGVALMFKYKLSWRRAVLTTGGGGDEAIASRRVSGMMIYGKLDGKTGPKGYLAIATVPLSRKTHADTSQ